MTAETQQGALYLRVRPQEFEDVLGNDAAVSILKTALGKPEATRPHVYAFSGTRGTGKTTLARICAKALGAWEQDIHEINCGTDTGKADAETTIHSFQYLPDGPCSVYILDEIHAISSAAWKAFLKPTEDCPRHVYVFALTSEPNKIPDANMSRMMHLPIKPLSPKDAKVLIRRTTKSQGIELDPEAWGPIIEASEGSSRQILQNVEKVADALASGSQLEDALLLLTGTTEDAPGVKELYNALRSGNGIRDTLKGLKALDAEALRRGVLGYANAVWLNGGHGRDMDIIRAMSSGNTFDTGFPGLVALCSMLMED